MYLCSVILFIKNHIIMNNQNIVSQPVPDFGALLESVKENGRLMRESAERYQKEWVEREKKREKERQEREAKLEKEKQEREEAEKKRYEQWEADRQAFKDRMDKISADTNKSIKEMREVFTTQWGRLVEELCKPAAYSLFKKEGIEIDRVYEGIRKAKVEGQDVMEIDVALCDTSVAVIVEVKSRCGRRDIDYFLSQMEHCKEWYPDFADKKLLVAVAAIQYNDEADTYAQKLGLYVLKLSGEDTFTMQAPKIPKEF